MKTATIGYYFKGAAYCCAFFGTLLAIAGILRVNPWLALIGGLLIGRVPSYLRRAEFVAHPDFRQGVRVLAEVREAYTRN